MRVLQGRKLFYHYPKGPLLLQDINLHVDQGECVVLTGPSGCGKSTLCKILAGIIPRSIPGYVQGDVLLLGKHINNLSLLQTVERVGVVFQDPNFQLFSPTVEAELAFGPENLCLPETEIDRRITGALEAVQLSSLRREDPGSLSQGQKQLVALASILTLQPQILILDEIFAPLDPVATALVKAVIEEQKNKGHAVLLVDHNPDLVLADRIYKMEDGHVWEVSYDRNSAL